jgi:tRNA1Val (adenine37-N6)-methyltransferase
LSLLLEGETIEDLQCNGLQIIQKKQGFRFGVDAVLLANFVKAKKEDKIIDLGTGTGIIPILLSSKTKAREIIGIDIQEDLIQMAKRSIELNSLSDRVRMDLKDIRELSDFPKDSFDLVTSNPPYKPIGTGVRNELLQKDISRHEVLCTLEDVIRLAERLLKTNGQFFMVHKPERLADIMCLLRKYKIEPKCLQFIHPKPYKKPYILLIHATKYGGKDLKILPPHYLNDFEGKDS